MFLKEVADIIRGWGDEFFAKCHVVGPTLSYHPHIHCVMPGGGVDVESAWHNFNGCEKNGNFLFPVQALSLIFRAKFVAMLAKNLKEHDVGIQQSRMHDAVN